MEDGHLSWHLRVRKMLAMQKTQKNPCTEAPRWEGACHVSEPGVAGARMVQKLGTCPRLGEPRVCSKWSEPRLGDFKQGSGMIPL